WRSWSRGAKKERSSPATNSARRFFALRPSPTGRFTSAATGTFGRSATSENHNGPHAFIDRWNRRQWKIPVQADRRLGEAAAWLDVRRGGGDRRRLARPRVRLLPQRAPGDRLRAGRHVRRDVGGWVVRPTARHHH